MKNLAAITFGIGMFAVAALLALHTTSQDTTPQQQVARVFATALHSSPTPLPTSTPTPIPTLTPEPTVTPVAGWIKFSAGGVELWLPPNYAELRLSNLVKRKYLFSRAPLDGDVVLHAYDTQNGLELPLSDLTVLRVKTDLMPSDVPFGVEVPDGAFETPAPVSLGRYQAFRTVSNGPNFMGIPLQMKDLIYWIRHGQFYWLLIGTSPAYDWDRLLPILEKSVRSFTILADE